jgi:hypothetical protein
MLRFPIAASDSCPLAQCRSLVSNELFSDRRRALLNFCSIFAAVIQRTGCLQNAAETATSPRRGEVTARVTSPAQRRGRSESQLRVGRRGASVRRVNSLDRRSNLRRKVVRVRVISSDSDLRERLDGKIRQASFDRGFNTPKNQAKLCRNSWTPWVCYSRNTKKECGVATLG